MVASGIATKLARIAKGCAVEKYNICKGRVASCVESDIEMVAPSALPNTGRSTFCNNGAMVKIPNTAAKLSSHPILNRFNGFITHKTKPAKEIEESGSYCLPTSGANNKSMVITLARITDAENPQRKQYSNKTTAVTINESFPFVVHLFKINASNAHTNPTCNPLTANKPCFQTT